MSKTGKVVLLWSILFMTVYFIGCGSGPESEQNADAMLKRDGRESIVHREMFVLLDEYRRACIDTAYTRDKWKGIDDNFICYWYQEMGYGFQDINGDGEKELIVGRLHDSDFSPVIIHAYDKEGVVSWGITDYYKMTIYDGGILWIEQSEEPNDVYIYRMTADMDLLEEASWQTGNRDNELQTSGKENFECFEENFCKTPKELEWKPLVESEELVNKDDVAAREQKIILSLLEEYERACEDAFYTEGKWKKININFSCYFDREIGYCIKDINSDGTNELFIGYMQDSEYSPVIIHLYDLDSGTMPSWNISDYYDMEVYENGIISVKSEGIISSNYIYEIGNNMNLNMVKRLHIDARDRDNVLFYEETDGDRSRITQEEFEEFRKRYFSILAEMEWKPLQGFWNP